MARASRGSRSRWWSAALLTAVAGCAAGAGATGGGGGGDDPGLEDGNTVDQPEPTFIARNEGGGDLAVRLGGATFSGDAAGPLESGTLRLQFDDQGVLLSIRGTLLADFFGLPGGSEIIFDYAAQVVTGAYLSPDGASIPIQDYLQGTGQALDLRSIVVTLTGDSLFARTEYDATLAAQPIGPGFVTIEATLRFGTNDRLQGAVRLPNHLDNQLPTFTLDRT